MVQVKKTSEFGQVTHSYGTTAMYIYIYIYTALNEAHIADRRKEQRSFCAGAPTQNTSLANVKYTHLQQGRVIGHLLQLGQGREGAAVRASGLLGNAAGKTGGVGGSDVRRHAAGRDSTDVVGTEVGEPLFAAFERPGTPIAWRLQEGRRS